jgi:hypothetical protein
MKKAKAAGGWKAIFYSLRTARRAGGLWRMYKGLRSKNACKTCALGMGGQAGGMVNETGKFPSVCKKSVQAMAADMQGQVRPDFFEIFDLAKLRGFSPRELEASGRLVEPLYAGPGDDRYRPIEWDEALKKVAARLEATPPEESFFYFSGRSSNEAGFLLQLFARLYGTNNVNNCSYYCHQASGVGLNSVVGSGTATIVLEDINRCDLLFLIGANPASNHPRLMHTLVKLRRRGGKVIVVNPLQEPGLVRFKVPSDVPGWSVSRSPPTFAACCSARRSLTSTFNPTSAETSPFSAAWPRRSTRLRRWTASSSTTTPRDGRSSNSTSRSCPGMTLWPARAWSGRRSSAWLLTTPGPSEPSSAGRWV